MIAITEKDLGELKTGLQVPVISLEYSDLAYVFSENAANTLPKHEYYDLCLETTGTLPFGPLYNLSQNEFEIF